MPVDRSACFGLTFQLLIVLRVRTRPRKSHRAIKLSERFAISAVLTMRLESFCERGARVFRIKSHELVFRRQTGIFALWHSESWKEQHFTSTKVSQPSRRFGGESRGASRSIRPICDHLESVFEYLSRNLRHRSSQPPLSDNPQTPDCMYFSQRMNTILRSLQ